MNGAVLLVSLIITLYYYIGDGVYDNINNEEFKTCIDFCLSKELIANDIHDQVANSVDFILKASLVRQTLDNITCVMLYFSGFERLFNAKRQSYGLPESKPVEKPKNPTSSSNRDQVRNSLTKQNAPSSNNEEKESARKIKTANGMIKKNLQKNQLMSSSIVSNEMKEKDKTAIKGTTMYNSNFSNTNQDNKGVYIKNQPSIKGNNNSNVMANLVNQQQDPNSRYARELNEYVPNIPSTTKASKSKYLNFFQKPGI